MGVEGAEFRRQLEGCGFGREGFERGEDGGSGHLRGAGTDEDVVDVVNLEEDAGVADEACGAHFVSMLGEDGADKGAEVGRAIDNEDAVAGLVVDGGRGWLMEEGQDGFLLGGVRLKDGGEHGDVEDFDDHGWGRGEADVAGAFTQIGGVADEEAEAGRVEAGDARDVEDDAVKLADGGLEGGFEGLGFFAGDDAAGALDDGDVAAEADFDNEGHACSLELECATRWRRG